MHVLIARKTIRDFYNDKGADLISEDTLTMLQVLDAKTLRLDTRLRILLRPSVLGDYMPAIIRSIADDAVRIATKHAHTRVWKEWAKSCYWPTGDVSKQEAIRQMSAAAYKAMHAEVSAADSAWHWPHGSANSAAAACGARAAAKAAEVVWYAIDTLSDCAKYNILLDVAETCADPADYLQKRRGITDSVEARCYDEGAAHGALSVFDKSIYVTEMTSFVRKGPSQAIKNAQTACTLYLGRIREALVRSAGEKRWCSMTAPPQ